MHDASRVTCVIATIYSWLGIRFLRFASRGRTTGAAPDNLPRFLGHGISRSPVASIARPASGGPAAARCLAALERLDDAHASAAAWASPGQRVGRHVDRAVGGLRDVTISCISGSNRLGINNGSLPIHAARPMGLTSPLLRAAASPHPSPTIPTNSDGASATARTCRIKRERAYDNSLRSV